MTREEAIKQLDTMWKMLTSAYDEIADSFVVAYTMAVDVLKAQMVKSDDLKVESAQNVQNGDLISRNLAIDELYKMLHDYFWTDDEELDAIIATLNDLPSAQPEIIRCKDCKHGVDYYHEGDCYCSNPKWGLTYFGGSWEFYCADAERRTDGKDRD